VEGKATACTQTRSFREGDDELRVLACLKHWCNQATKYPSRLTHMEFKPQFDQCPPEDEILAQQLDSDYESDGAAVGPKPEAARGRGRGRGRRCVRGRGIAQAGIDSDSGSPGDAMGPDSSSDNDPFGDDVDMVARNTGGTSSSSSSSDSDSS
jgi:hypothetical protein